ncbi:MAG: hypothetical protein AAGA72_17235 [Pseudomonadota bacterium]
MIFNRFASTLCAVSAGAFIALIGPQTAQASPRFTVTNDTDTKINVYIFKGDDSVCTWEEKLKSVSPGETDSYGCTGGGNGQCKVQFYAKGGEICTSNHNTCSKNATKVKGGKTVTITEEDRIYTCQLS